MTRALFARLRREDGGFTLIELTATMAVLGIFFAAVALVLGGAIRNSSAVEDQAVTQNEARGAIDALASDLRQAYSDATLPGGIWVQTMTGTTLTFYSPDRQTPFHLRRISYQLSGGQLQRAAVTSTNTGAGPWVVGGTALSAAALGTYGTLVGSVTNASPFTYLDASGNPTATAANVVRVVVTLTISPRGSQGKKSTYIVNATPRT